MIKKYLSFIVVIVFVLANTHFAQARIFQAKQIYEWEVYQIRYEYRMVDYGSGIPQFYGYTYTNETPVREGFITYKSKLNDIFSFNEGGFFFEIDEEVDTYQVYSGRELDGKVFYTVENEIIDGRMFSTLKFQYYWVHENTLRSGDNMRFKWAIGGNNEHYVTFETIEIPWKYVGNTFSSNRNEYPRNGTKDGLYYIRKYK